MMLRDVLAAAAALAAMPAVAQTVHDTHAEVSVPSGKVPTKMYRPLRAENCRPAFRHHQTGKVPAAPPALAEQSGCAAAELALGDAPSRR